LNTDDVHVILSCEVEAVVGVFDSLEAREWKRSFRDSAPNDGSGIDLVESLKEYETILRDCHSWSARSFDEKQEAARTHLEIFEQIVNARIDIERVEPKSEDTRFSFAFSIEVFDNRSFVLLERFQTWVGVEQVCDESEVEFGVSGDE